MPTHPDSHTDPQVLSDFITLCRGRSLAALTGAGISTGAGLPDYRGTGASGSPTVDIDLFLSDVMWQKWVWERNQITWKALTSLEPTQSHYALAQLEADGLLLGVATQNVDGLHEKAGSQHLAPLHGSFMRVDCMRCHRQFPREWLDTELRACNPQLRDDPDPTHVAILAKVDRSGAQHSKLTLVYCPECGGILKPNVVFFGEMLPEDALNDALTLAGSCEVLLVVGTSVKVSTAVWVAHQAIASRADLVVINQGPCELDGHPSVALRIDADAEDYLPYLADALRP